jgi:Holliday junction resolvase-like predicted endonuclease
MKDLPIGTQSFSTLRTTNCVYVDKTQHIYNLTKHGRVFFISRPRRFGKSLLISTLQALFEGRKELFEGLYIYDKWDWSIKYPVLRLDFGWQSYESADILKKSLTKFVKDNAKIFDIKIETDLMSDMFKDLIIGIKNKTGQKVVVLIDEYDKPMSDFLSKPNQADANRTVLHNFYQVLKAADENLKFIFLTGVSKFSGVSVFSALNNPNDITIDDRYATICGYTQEELETNFVPYIDKVAAKLNMTKEKLLGEIKYWYNGYTWDGQTRVYNPFSTLMFFDKQFFSDYWIKTAVSISNQMLLKDYSLLESLFKQIPVNYNFFDGFDLNNIGGNSFLFQSGYLTIKSRKITNGVPEYNLGIPNQEVKEALSLFMLGAYSNIDIKKLGELAATIKKQIQANNAADLENSLRSVYAQIPNNIHVKEEAYYHSIFLISMILLGFKLRAEVATNLGKIDAVWEQDKQTTVIEIKYSKDKTLDALIKEALNQIKEKKYYEPYMQKPVSLLAIAFAAGQKEDRLTEIACKFENLNTSSL